MEEMSRLERPKKRLAAIRSEEKTKESFSFCRDNSATRRINRTVMNDSNRDRSASPQIFGPTQPSVKDVGANNSKSPKRPRGMAKVANKSSAGEKPGSSASALRVASSTKENSSTMSKSFRPRKTKAAPVQPNLSTDEEEDLIIVQEKFYNVRETRSKSKRQVVETSTKSSTKLTTSKSTSEAKKSRKLFPATLVLSEDDDTDSETQLPSSIVDEKLNDLAPVPVIRISADQEDELGLQNIGQSLKETCETAFGNGDVLELTTETELVQETPPTSPSSEMVEDVSKTQSSAASSSSDGNEQIEAPNHNNDLQEIPIQNTVSHLLEDSDQTMAESVPFSDPYDVNMSQDLFATQSDNPGLGETPGAQHSPASNDNRANTGSDLDLSRNTTDNFSATVRPATTPEERAADSSSSSIDFAIVPKKSNGKVSQPVIKFRKPVTCKKGTSAVHVRVASTKRHESASKLPPSSLGNPFDEPSRAIAGPSRPKLTPVTLFRSEVVSKLATKNNSMRDSGDYFIASVPITDSKDTVNSVIDDSSELNLSRVEDKADVFEDSIPYGDPSILTILAFEPLKDCKDVITQSLLLRLSTNASVQLLENAVRTKGITTVGELCSLYILKIHQLPIVPSPKIATFQNVMTSYAQEHYPHVLLPQENPEERIQPSASTSNASDEAEGSAGDLVGETSNQPVDTDSGHQDDKDEVPYINARRSLESNGNSDNNIDGEDDSGSRQRERLALEPHAAGDWEGFAIRILRQQLTPEQKKAVLIKLFQDVMMK